MSAATTPAPGRASRAEPPAAADEASCGSLLVVALRAASALRELRARRASGGELPQNYPHSPAEEKEEATPEGGLPDGGEGLPDEDSNLEPTG